MNNGGPAFPFHSLVFDTKKGNREDWHTGLSVRDYFAASVVTGFAQNTMLLDNFDSKTSAAKVAYEWADAMLAARDKDGAA